MAKKRNSRTYEAARDQQIQLNKKKLEALGILKISKSLAEPSSSGNNSLQRLPKPKPKTTNVSEPRRSARARNPVPSYREDIDIGLPPLRKRSRPNSSGRYLARPLDEVREASEKERERAFEAAVELQSNLKSGNPSFVKSMGLPSKFCEDHLPKTLLHMVLEDEDGMEFEATYLGNRSGLSGGWRAFALNHKLDDGDALVFELTEPTRFKIYIVKAFPLFVQKQSEDYEDKEEIPIAKTTAKAGLRLELCPKQTRKLSKAAVHAGNSLENSQKLQPKRGTNSEDKSQDENKSKTRNGLPKSPKRKVNQLQPNSELKKVGMVENSDKCAPRKSRKKPAPKHPCKKAFSRE